MLCLGGCVLAFGVPTKPPMFKPMHQVAKAWTTTAIHSRQVMRSRRETLSSGHVPVKGMLGGPHDRYVFSLTLNGEVVEVETLPHHGLFADGADIKVHGKDGEPIRTVQIDKTQFRIGRLNGYPNNASSAHVYHHPDGVHVDAIITLHNETYRLEPAHRYPDLAGDVDAGLHTAVFRDTDVIHPWHAAGTSDDHASTAPHSCGTEAHAKLLERQEELGLNVNSRKNQNKNKNNANAGPPVETEYTFPPPGEQFSFFGGGEANVPRSMYRRGSQPDRSRRSDNGGGADGADGGSSKKVVCSGACSCPVSLYCDQTFFQGPYGEGNEGLASQNMINMLMASDAIYYASDFGDLTGIGSIVREVTVYTNGEGGNPVGLPAGSYEGPEGATKYLEDFGKGAAVQADLADSCLGVMFAHRDFNGGTLGLAWVSEPGNTAGICSDGFNTAWVTTLNFDSNVAMSVAQVTLAHELGHNHGSPHDETAACSPGGDGGNYIMFPQATDGSKANNKLFSLCSRNSISASFLDKRDQCFSQQREYCGNGWVEGDEECDCGDDCDGSCCNEECKVADGKQCSPQDAVANPCCNEQCEFIAADTNTLCSKGTECLQSQVCDGGGSSCPANDAVSDDTFCGCQQADCDLNPNTHTRYCAAGSCSVSICEYFGAADCELPAPKGCELACNGTGWGDNVTCVSSFDEDNRPADFPGGVQLPSGSTCQGFEGYCDPGGECVTVSSEDLLERLKDIFKRFNTSAILNWITEDWMRSGGILGGIVVLCAALYCTKRKQKKGKTGYAEMDGTYDSDDEEATDYGSGSKSQLRRKGTVFQNAKQKF